MIKTKEKRIVICDDHILFLRGIEELLKTLGKYRSIITFSNADECKVYIQTNQIDLFICDLNINGVDGFTLIGSLKKELKTVKTIILTAYLEDFLIDKARDMGIHSFLKKETPAEELIAVMEADLNAPFYSNKINRSSPNYFSDKDDDVIKSLRLTRQEKEIIKLIIKGQTSNEIATALFVSKTTIDTHRKNIHKKLGVTNSSTLIKFANENNLFS